ncbi:MAG: chalcone isomerase family protein, partial [Thioalkalispiraceae bacterium]
MKKIFTQLFSVCLMLLPGYVFALAIAGIDIPEHIRQKATQHELVLNGAGIRSKFIFDIYVGALYLTT